MTHSMPHHPRRSLLFTLVTLLLLAPAPFVRSAQAAGDEKHSLWKVQGKTNALHLFGSIHFLKQEYYPLPEPIEAAYRQSQCLVLEADLEEANAPKMRLMILRLARCPEGKTLKDMVGKETYDSLQVHLKNAAGVGGLMDQFKPWMAAVTLLTIELQRLGFNPQQGVDQHFYDAARRDQKTIVPLETVEFQIKLLDSLSDLDGEAMLKETLQEISTFKKILGDMTQAWQTGDSKKLEELVLASMRDFPELRKKLLTERNERWCGVIEKMLAEGKEAFVVVGAAHLVGKEGLVEMLSKKGFKVEQK
jgi:uncharacterized protein